MGHGGKSQGLMSMDMSIHAYDGYAQAWAYGCMSVWLGSLVILIHLHRCNGPRWHKCNKP